ncbi:uncharacterized protein LACBIDRAFT_329460 [Laccaria bicolor S238N-H82]|uniref:Predicted protein n=1 Tax=Laccaria bicolor (strain S238N-H82 / ATCC MYA-4686) TaxID=486041 RepID=B0DI36_LACBS|nr:uncharacterized protein LACBIDRAFT_329460 [Laccaria bicolor S238N-H82]EDR05840.1 predicted protein [Laccaria bicolor S238N-H82]|eukprot:XP_001883516.1 predicted protein [Laccaria bicolor S238N-H82]
MADLVHLASTLTLLDGYMKDYINRQPRALYNQEEGYRVLFPQPLIKVSDERIANSNDCEQPRLKETLESLTKEWHIQPSSNESSELETAIMTKETHLPIPGPPFLKSPIASGEDGNSNNDCYLGAGTTKKSAEDHLERTKGLCKSAIGQLAARGSGWESTTKSADTSSKALVAKRTLPDLVVPNSAMFPCMAWWNDKVQPREEDLVVETMNSLIPPNTLFRDSMVQTEETSVRKSG